MAWIDKNLYPSLNLIDSFKKMKKVRIQGISFMEKRNISFSKEKNKISMTFNTQINEHMDVDSAKNTTLPEFTFQHNNRSYIVPKDMSRIVKYKDNFTSNGLDDFSTEINADAMYSDKIDFNRKYYFRYFVPVETRLNFEDYAHYGFKCKGKHAGSLIKIARGDDEIHFYKFEYSKKFYLVVESTRQCLFNEIESLAYSSLLTLGFFSGVLHLNETYIVVSKSRGFNSPVGLYYKSLRETISGQYNIFTTNAYSVLIPISKKMKAQNAEDRMMKIIEEKWKFRIDRVQENVFSNIMNLFNEHESIARAALISLSASRLGLELQAGVYCIAFETICNSINKIYNLQVPHVIDEKQWNTIKHDLLDIFNKSSLSTDAKNFGKNKINNFNQPTNKDKLTLSFNAVGYILSANEIKAISDRNLFLHGHLNVKNNEKEIDKLFYTSIMFHRLCCTLILKMAGFNGHIINNIALYSPDINIKGSEWGFKKI